MMQGRNFDDIADKFSNNIYGTSKGRIRQAIMTEELETILKSFPSGPLSIVDAGGGEGLLSSTFAARGHQVLLCDLSAEMLQRASQLADQKGVSENMVFKQISAQAVVHCLDEPVDLILSHAVLEWVTEPEAMIASFYQALRPGGVLSLMFYNLHGLQMQTLILGNFGYMQANLKKRKKKTLSPDFPREPATVYQWLTSAGFVIEDKVGVRVFHDYLRDKNKQTECIEDILVLEKQFSRQEPFLSLGRYIHVTARKPVEHIHE